jgi:osmotically-inducible protein OsmY
MSDALARVLVLGSALLALASLTSCVVAAVGGAAATGGYVAGQEKGPGAIATDERIRVEINKKWFDYSSDMSGQLTLAVNNGEVLIAGAVSNPDWKVEAVRLAWQVDGVKKVDSEIEFSDKSSVSDLARDKLITYRLRSALIWDGKVRSLNYTIDTVNGVVYLTGSARTQGELDLVTNYARNIPNVKRVVSYVQVRPGETPAPVASNAPQGTPPSAGTPQNSAPAGQAGGEPPPPPQANPAPVTSPTGPAKIEVTPLQ